MISAISAVTQQPHHIQLLVEKIDELLELQAISHHEYLRIVLPKDILHWPKPTAMHDQARIVIQIGVMGTVLEAVILACDKSDTSGMTVETLTFDRENGESTYAIKGILLSAQDIRALIIYLLSEFFPCSLSITESE